MKTYKKVIIGEANDFKRKRLHNFFWPYLLKLDSFQCVKFALFCAILESSQKPKCKIWITVIKSWLLTHSEEDKAHLGNIVRRGLGESAAYCATVITNRHANSITCQTLYLFNALFFALRQDKYRRTRTIQTYLDILLNKERYLIKDELLKAFVNQDIDQIDTVLPIVDYIQDKYEVDLTELSKNVRIFVEFLRGQG